MDCNKLVEDRTPELEMEFNSEEDAYKFYNNYAFKTDFNVCKDYLNKDKDGVTTSRRYSYCKEGVKRKYEGMLIDYNFFGDVVTFDTTYKINKEYHPLVVFVGFNQLRQIVIFDAALMYDETIDSFKWVFGTFRKVMCGKRPNTILTDQDHAMAAALSVIMPETFHGLYTFHIRRNFMKHLGNHYKKNSDLPYMFGACMYEFEEVEQFNRVWEAMVKKYNLENNKWLFELYQIRDKWFFRHFNRVIDDKRHNELITEYEMRQKLPMVGLRQTPVLVHATETYSPTVFVAFQNEYDESTAMVILRQQDAGIFVEFAVMRYDGGSERIVVFNRNDLNVHCSCKKYENEGILCGHSLKVFDTVGIKTIPLEYVKRRWTRRARAGDCFDR
ncbi:protein FAR1-RELATED SEQUENCE 7-like [Coffea eugenioides]|uniref:protein FAR1-RELATED SEQUENCE 7-like n=1 Tax=Coffea eugenioides TaxID=49369 RepID=UPI000F614B35|nr:protein FAR1-RELATED SEQUENCE 7-like [Coffea eugenioides]